VATLNVTQFRDAIASVSASQIRTALASYHASYLVGCFGVVACVTLIGNSDSSIAVFAADNGV